MKKILTKLAVLMICFSFITDSCLSKCGASAGIYNITQDTGFWAPISATLTIYINTGDSVSMALTIYGSPGLTWNGWYYNNVYFCPVLTQPGFGSTAQLKFIPLPGTYYVSGGDINCSGYAEFHVLSLTTSGFQEHNYLTNLKLFPNPARENLTILFSSALRNVYILTFTNAFGSVVKEYYMQNVSGNFKKEEDVSELADGVYFLSIHNNDMIETRRFLKIRE